MASTAFLRALRAKLVVDVSIERNGQAPFLGDAPFADLFAQDLDLQHTADHAAQTRREPELVVVAGTTVQAHDEPDLAQARLEHVDVRRQVGRTAFLAAFDHAHAARPGNALRVERGDRGQRCVHGITVVSAAAAIEQTVFVLRRPGPQVVAPAAEFGLFVEVAVKQDRVAVSGACRGDFEKD